MQAIAADQAVRPVSVGAGSQEAATDTPQPADTDYSGAGWPPAPIDLPSSITGQTADEQTCRPDARSPTSSRTARQGLRCTHPALSQVGLRF